MLRFFLQLLIFLSLFKIETNCYSVENNDPNISFLMSIKDMIADYEQEQYDTKNITLSSGKIIVKKPDSVLITFNDGQMKLKIISINGNFKIVDENIKQTTYVKDYYSELMQFFTKNINPDKIKKNKNGDLCMPFNHFNDNFIACLSVDVKKKTLLKIVVFKERPGKKDNKKQNNGMYPVMSINFKNVRINKGVKESVFYIKDNRIFRDDEL